MKLNVCCFYVRAGMAGVWLHAEWLEQRVRFVGSSWIGLSGAPPGGEVRRCTLTYLPVQARQCWWWEQQGWYAAGPLLDREAFS